MAEGKTIYSRFIAAQAKFEAIAKDKSAQAFGRGSAGYSYADINGVLETVRPVLNAEGLGLTQSVTTDEQAGTVAVVTAVFDGAGDKLESGIFTASTAGLTQRGVQALGSAITYARRYSLMAFLGLALGERDDDGREAVAGHYQSATRPAAPAPRPPVESFEVLERALAACENPEHLRQAGDRIKASQSALTQDQRTALREAFLERKAMMTDAPAE